MSPVDMIVVIGLVLIAPTIFMLIVHVTGGKARPHLGDFLDPNRVNQK